ncbi:MAG: hypothetical protein PHP45_10885 [Elusimicrobiales bacterium]|nr:hypothetical protein [Elusimicrobiales bacterium]
MAALILFVSAAGNLRAEMPAPSGGAALAAPQELLPPQKPSRKLRLYSFSVYDINYKAGTDFHSAPGQGLRWTPGSPLNDIGQPREITAIAHTSMSAMAVAGMLAATGPASIVGFGAIAVYHLIRLCTGVKKPQPKSDWDFIVSSKH